MRILFAGSPGIAVPALEAVAHLCRTDANFAFAGLLCNADSPRGRSGKLEPAECAAAMSQVQAGGRAGAGIKADPVPILKPEKLDEEVRAAVASLKPDLLVSFAYGKIFGPKFLALFPLGGINIHPSLLPRYRGPAPIPAVIFNREKETGITIQRLAEKMDSGDILVQETVPLDGHETTESLSGLMAEKAARLLPALLKSIATGTMQPKPQNHGEATYCSLIKKSEGLIDWKQSAAEIDARIRACNPWPLTWTIHNGTELFILQAQAVLPAIPVSPALMPGKVLGKCGDKGILIQTGDGVLAASVLQYRSKKALDWKSFLNGARNFIGGQLGI